MTCSLPRRLPLLPSKYSMTAMIFVMMLSFYYFSRHVSDCTHFSFAHELSGPPEKWAQVLRTKLLRVPLSFTQHSM